MLDYRVNIEPSNGVSSVLSTTYEQAIRFIYTNAEKDGYDFWQRLDYGDKEVFIFCKTTDFYPYEIADIRTYEILNKGE